MESKQTKIGFMFMFLLAVALFVSAEVSALEFDNVKSYDSVTREVTITNSFGLGADIGKARLNTPLNYKVAPGYQKVAEFDLWAYQDYNDILKSIEFYDKNQKDWEKAKFKRAFDIKYKTYENVLIDDFKTECSIDEKSLNKTQTCQEIKIGSHYENQEVWKKINPATLKKNEVVTIGIFTDVKIGDYVEWIPQIYGVKINEWATWTADLNVGLISYWKLDETSGTIAIDSVRGFNGTISNGITINQAGKINKSIKGDNTANAKISVPHNNLLNGGAELSLGLWRKGNTSSLEDLFLKGTDTNTTRNYWLRIIGGKISFSFHDGTTYREFTTTNVVTSNNTWEFIVATYNDANNNVSIYVNANLVQSFTTTSSLVSNTLPLQLCGDVVGYTCTSFIDEMFIYNRTINLSEITQLYNNGDGMTYISSFDQPPTITLNSPADNLQSTSSTINFNATINPINAKIKNVTLYLNDEEYLDLYDTNETINYSKILTLSDGDYTWNITACWIGVSTEEDCTESDTRTFRIDTTLPNITILSGNGTQPYYYSGINHTINFTIEDDNLDSGWWRYGYYVEVYDKDSFEEDIDGWYEFMPGFSRKTDWSSDGIYSFLGSNLDHSPYKSINLTALDRILFDINITRLEINNSYFAIDGLEKYKFNQSGVFFDVEIDVSDYNGIHNISFYRPSGFEFSEDRYYFDNIRYVTGEKYAEGTLLTKDYTNTSEISSFTTTSFVKIDEIKVGTLLNYTSGEIKSSSGSYQKELLQSIVYMNGTVVNQTKNTASTTYVLDVFMNPNPNEIVDRVEYWAREVSTSGTGYVQNQKVSPLKEEVRQFSVTVPVTKDVYDFSIYANDTFGNVASKEVEWDYLFFEENRSYPNETIDTKQETISIDITSLYDLTVNLNYSGTIYPTLEQIIAPNKIRYYTILNIPNVAVNTNKTISWNIYSNQGNATTTESSLLVKSLNYSFNQPRQLLNITIYDEITGDKLNNTQVEALVTYYLQNPIANKTLYEVHTNNNHTLGTNLEIDSLYTKNKFTYQLAGYQPREYLENLILVDGSITQLTLYLLSNSDGTTQLFSITEATTMEQLADVKLIAYEQVGTEYQYRDATYSDDSGSANLWLNPDKAHRITASKEGCTSKTISMYPTGVSIQNIELDCGGVIPGPSYNGSEYYTEYNITVSFNPTIKEISYDADTPSTHKKTFSVKYEDQSCNVTGAEFKLIDGDTGLVLNTITSLDCEDTLSLIQNVSGKTGIIAYLLLTKSTGETLTYRIIYRITDISDLAYDGSSISRILQKLTDMDDFGLDQKTKTFIAFIVLFLILGGLSMGGVIKSEGFSMYILILAYIAGLSYLGWFGLELPTTFSDATIQATVNKYMILFLSSLIIGGIALSKAND